MVRWQGKIKMERFLGGRNRKEKEKKKKKSDGE